jgi:hypothetical protein
MTIAGAVPTTQIAESDRTCRERERPTSRVLESEGLGGRRVNLLVSSCNKDSIVRFLGIVSLLSLLASCGFHAATFVPQFPAGILAVSLLLHAITLMLCTVALGGFVLHKRTCDDPSGKGVFAKWRSTLRNEQRFRETVIGLIPVPLQVVCFLMVVNAVANFILFGLATNGQEPTAGQVIRLFSSGWMVFLLFPTIYFLVIQPRLLALETREKKST